MGNANSVEGSYDSRIVILGAGVTGLTTALRLAQAGYKQIIIIAKYMPTDSVFEYSSAWAGANVVPVSQPNSRESKWDIVSWKEFVRLTKEVPEAGTWIKTKTAYYRNEDYTPDTLKDWFHDLVFNYKFLSKDEVPEFADWATLYDTVALDPDLYLHWLKSSCLAAGVQIYRHEISHIREAFTPKIAALPEFRADVVVNCSGLAASKLGGVNDDAMVHMLGQLVIVENESLGMWSVSGDSDMDDEIGESCYVIDRPAGGGTCIGGSYHVSQSQEIDMDLAHRMMRRAIKVCPHLVPKGSGIEALNVIRHQVGMRPVRKGGPRVEAETIQDEQLGQLKVVHSYGAGGFGYQSSYGMADDVVSLVRESLRSGGVHKS